MGKSHGSDAERSVVTEHVEGRAPTQALVDRFALVVIAGSDAGASTPR